MPTYYTDVTAIRMTWPVTVAQVPDPLMLAFCKRAYDVINAALAKVYPIPFETALVDLGQAWTMVEWQATSRHVHFVACDPMTGYLYAGLGDSYSPCILRSVDGEATWTFLRVGSVLAQPISMTFTPTSRIIGSDSGTTGNCIERTVDDTTWTKVLDLSGGLYDCPVWCMARQSELIMVAGTMSNGATKKAAMYATADGGFTWTMIKDLGVQADMKGFGCFSGFDSQGYFYYYQSSNGASYKGRIVVAGGVPSLENANDSIALHLNMCIAPDDSLIGSAGSVIQRSRSRGATWTTIGTLPEGTDLQGLFVARDGAVYASPKNSGHLFKGIESPADTWTWTNVLTFRGIGFATIASAWKMCEDADGSIFLGEYGGGTGDNDAYIWKGATAYGSSQVPAVIAEVSDMLTVYYGKLYTGAHIADPDALAVFKHAALELLAGLAAGWTKEGGPMAIPGVGRTVGLASTTEDYHTVFSTVLELEQLTPDADLIEADEDAREDD